MGLDRIAVVDSETTGLEPATCHCIEIAVTILDLPSAEVVASYQSLLFAPKNEAEHINRISPKLLHSAPMPTDVWPDVLKIVKMADVIAAHRADFDRGFVSPEVRDAKPWVCTKFHIDWPKGNSGDHLVHLALANGVPVYTAHRAAADVDTLVRMFQKVRADGVDLVELVTKAMRPRERRVALVSYDNREQARKAGFAWDGARKEWWRDIPLDDVAALPFKTRRAVP